MINHPNNSIEVTIWGAAAVLSAFLKCKTEEVVTGCPFCLKIKIKEMQDALKYYKREIELIVEEMQDERK